MRYTIYIYRRSLIIPGEKPVISVIYHNDEISAFDLLPYVTDGDIVIVKETGEMYIVKNGELYDIPDNSELRAEIYAELVKNSSDK